MTHNRARQKSHTKWLRLLIVLTLTACLPTSENPVTNPGRPATDADLIGTWYGALEDGDDALYLHVLRSDTDEEDEAPDGMDMILVADAEDDDGGWAILYALSAQFDDHGYLSIEFKEDSGEPVDEDFHGYHLYNYRIEGKDKDILRIRPIDEDELEELIETGQLAGTITKQQFSTDVRVTASQQDLTHYFETLDPEALFQDEFGRFRKQDPVGP